MTTTYDKDGAYIEVTTDGVVHRRSIKWADCVVSVPSGANLKVDSVHVNESDQLVLTLEDESEITLTAGAELAVHAALPTVHQNAPELITTHEEGGKHRWTDEKLLKGAGPDADPDEIDIPAAEVGGLYGINVETLSDDKTLTPGTDKIYQYLDEGGALRNITLDTASAIAGDRFIIRHNGVYNDTNRFNIKQGATLIDMLYAGGIKEFIFDGTDWVSRGLGTGEDNVRSRIVAIGEESIGYNGGTAIGYQAQGHTDGVAVGYSARGHTDGVAIGKNSRANSAGVGVGEDASGITEGIAIGYSADGEYYGVALGCLTDTNLKKYSIALGYYSECERVGETSININGADSDQENNVVQGRWERRTTNATPIEIFCAGQANKRFTIRASSVLAFTMLIVARDNVANEVARYSVSDGLIKRDAAGNTIMVNCTVVTDYEDDAGWDVAVIADDTNEALIITVTGDATNPVQWAAVMDGVETHF